MSILQLLTSRTGGIVTRTLIDTIPTPISFVFDSGDEIVYFNDEEQTTTPISFVFDGGDEIVYFTDEEQTTTPISFAFSGT